LAELDALDLGGGHRLVIATVDGRLAAIPMSGGARARPGDGTAEALVALLRAGPGRHGRFTVRAWQTRTAAGERPMGVDQTNESVIVGDAAVVKWATHLQQGPHPAPHRIGVLRDAGFGGMPTPWGLVTWRDGSGDDSETLVASVDDYLPGAVDGWTWAVELITEAVRADAAAPLRTAATDVGTVTAELHTALSSTASTADAATARRWRDTALQTLDRVCDLPEHRSTDTARAYRAEIAATLDELAELAGAPVLDGHGDLHVGQILRSGGRFVVTDFDGNPVLPAADRIVAVPAALDVAGMAQSLTHAGIVAARYAELDAAALAAVDRQARAAFLDAYTDRLTKLGHGDLYQPRWLYPLRLQQVLREILYAAHHLPRWMYVPDAALPALLDERPPS
jgi:maltokinase